MGHGGARGDGGGILVADNWPKGRMPATAVQAGAPDCGKEEENGECVLVILFCKWLVMFGWMFY